MRYQKREVDRVVVTLDISQLADRQTRTEPLSQSGHTSSAVVEQPSVGVNSQWDSSLNEPLHLVDTVVTTMEGVASELCDSC